MIIYATYVLLNDFRIKSTGLTRLTGWFLTPFASVIERRVALKPQPRSQDFKQTLNA